MSVWNVGVGKVIVKKADIDMSNVSKAEVEQARMGLGLTGGIGEVR